MDFKKLQNYECKRLNQDGIEIPDETIDVDLPDQTEKRKFVPGQVHILDHELEEEIQDDKKLFQKKVRAKWAQLLTKKGQFLKILIKITSTRFTRNPFYCQKIVQEVRACYMKVHFVRGHVALIYFFSA